MYNGKEILAVIPARGGSKGVPRKNIRLLAGKPLIAWTIEEANKSKYIDCCIVSTEDEEIKRVAEQHGGEVPFMRPVYLAKDDTPGIDPVLHAIGMLPQYEYIMLLQATSPLRRSEDIDGCIEFFFDRNAASCVSVTEAEHSPYWMYRVDSADRLLPIITIEDDRYYQRQRLPKVYRLNGAIYLAKKSFLLVQKNYISDKTIGYIMPSNRSQDIDTIMDFRMVEFMMTENNRKLRYECVSDGN